MTNVMADDDRHVELQFDGSRVVFREIAFFCCSAVSRFAVGQPRQAAKS
jgi:hypothetical protein